MPTLCPRPTTRSPIAQVFISMALLACIGCGDDAPEATPLARVGEPCMNNKACEVGLACLQTELRCVILCTPQSDECGSGIECQLAGDQGFCPLPPL